MIFCKLGPGLFLVSVLYEVNFITYCCCVMVCKPPISLQFLVQFPLRSILQNEVDTRFIIEVAVHTQDMWMPKHMNPHLISSMQTVAMY